MNKIWVVALVALALLGAFYLFLSHGTASSRIVASAASTSGVAPVPPSTAPTGGSGSQFVRIT